MSSPSRPSPEPASTGGEGDASAATCSLEEVLITAELRDRPARTPDHAAENAALIKLSKSLTESTQTVLQELTDAAMQLCRAGSAGISLEETRDGQEVFCWRAVSGVLRPFLGGTLPRRFSPCGVTVDARATQLMREPVRYYPYIADLKLPIHEVLLVPFFREKRAAGTLWIVAHEPGTAFDAEDARLVGSLCAFAATAFDLMQNLETAERSQAALAEVQQKLETALDVSAVGTWSWDILKDRVFADETCAQLFAVSPEEAHGGRLAQYLAAIHDEDRDRVSSEITSAIQRNESYEIEYRVTDAGARQRWVMARGTVLHDFYDRPTHIAGVVMDITVRKIRQLASEQQEQARWDAAQELNEALRQARDQALAASRAKDEFLAALSHELRTPLNPVLMLASDAAENPAYSAEVREDFENVRKNIELEARLIDDLLDVTRITSGKLKLDLRPANVHAVIHDAENKIEADAEAKRITIHRDLRAGHALVSADAVRLQQVFWNVLKNAVKFTPEGGSIRLESRATDDGRAIQVQIHDTGIGIPAGEIGDIFSTFAQGTNLEQRGGAAGGRSFGGLGLGLAIAQKVMQMHGGSITASSAGRGEGSCFTIELPLLMDGAQAASGGTPGSPGLSIPAPSAALSPAGALRDGTPADGAPPAGALRILIVEDHAPSRQALARLLTRRSHAVTAAASGQEACAAVTAQPFDLIICDVGLPDTSGHLLLHDLLRLRPGIPAIAITGFGTESDVRKSDIAGFLIHLTKPISIARLEAALATIQARPRPAA